MSAPIPCSPSFASLASADECFVDPLADGLSVSPRVRFDHECVLIPDPLPNSRLPRLVTKSYSLPIPLWKRKQRDPSVVSDTEEDPEDHVVFKVSVPSLTTKARSPSRDAAHRPLVSCLVHTLQPSSSTDSESSIPPAPARPRQGRARGASLPQPVQADAVTVPLRSCCAQCYACIDRCMKQGDHWQVLFSKGAARRRKSVSDAHRPSPSRSARHCVREAMPGFDAIVAVDEVDRRRRSTEIEALAAVLHQTPGAVLAMSAAGPESDDLQLRRALSLPNESHPCRVAGLHTHLHLRTASIPEEDELRPSPRRTPIASPFASTTNLPSTRIVHGTQSKLVQRVTSPSDAKPEKVALQAPLPASPSPPPREKEPPSYFSMSYQPSTTPADRYYADSPTSSPSSSPRIDHAAPAGLGTPRKRSLMHLAPATIFRASTQMLKGISGMAGPPMSV
ncbi:hypothetical protein C2E23DRAFT_834708 [Lenzites betulinus]|nr:hypothetical protein C2E23DRAFT_834708 [Lenzites betulinus]